MDPKSIFDYVVQLIAGHYADILVAMIFTPFFIYIWKWMQGTEEQVKHHRKRFLLGSAILGGLFALVLIGTVQEIRPKEKSSKPELRCSLIVGQVGISYNGSKPSVIYNLKVVNSGSPSIAWKWHIKISIGGQTIEKNALETPFNETLFDPNNTNSPPLTLDQSTYLPNVLLENPVSNGAGKKGWVVFIIDSATQEDLIRIGNTFILQFEDCNNVVTSMTNTLTKSGGVFYYAP